MNIFCLSFRIHPENINNHQLSNNKKITYYGFIPYCYICKKINSICRH